jgi:glutamate racemase
VTAGNQSKPIGIFDSGLGGLTVFREIVNELPNEDLVYFGDTARVPYGSKSKDTIVHYTDQILSFLKTQEVKAIVVACNTASAYALEELEDRVEVPIVGVVKPGAKVAAKESKNGKIGVIGTKGTIRSGLYQKYLKEYRPGAEVFGKPCPLFVPLVEEGLWDDVLTRTAAARYLKELKEAGVDTLIMGCTHYPLIRPLIREEMGEDVLLVNPAHETAERMKEVLELWELNRDPAVPRSDAPYRFYVSDDPESFRDFASKILTFPLPLPEKIDIEAY